VLAVSAMLVCYPLEERSRTFILLFAGPAQRRRFTVSCKEPGRSVSSRPSGPSSPWSAGSGATGSSAAL